MGGRESILTALINKKKDLDQIKSEDPLFFIWKLIIGLIVLISSIIVGYQLFTNTEFINELIENSGTMGPLVYVSILSLAITMALTTSSLLNISLATPESIL